MKNKNKIYHIKSSRKSSRKSPRKSPRKSYRRNLKHYDGDDEKIWNFRYRDNKENPLNNYGSYSYHGYYYNFYAKGIEKPVDEIYKHILNTEINQYETNHITKEEENKIKKIIEDNTEVIVLPSGNVCEYE
jgi:hypothetical protein